MFAPCREKKLKKQEKKGRKTYALKTKKAAEKNSNICMTVSS
jgi:hypothetical protein